MKIKKEDIRKIINILEEADKNLKEGEFYVFENKLIIKEFKLPELWFLEKTEDTKKQQIIYDWMQKQINGDHWIELDFANIYHLVNKDPDYHSEIRPCGLKGNIIDNKLIYNDGTIFESITFEQFEKYVVNGEK